MPSVRSLPTLRALPVAAAALAAVVLPGTAASAEEAVGSTVVGELVDSAIFYPVAFLGAWETKTVITVLFTNYALKVLWEVLATPLTYRLVAFLKRVEHEDYFDRDTDFTPFTLAVD